MKFILVVLSLVTIIACGEEKKAPEPEVWPPGQKNGTLTKAEQDVLLEVALELGAFDDVSRSYRRESDFNSPFYVSQANTSTDRAGSYLSAGDCDLQKVDGAKDSVVSQGSDCLLQFRSVMGEKRLQKNNSGYTNQWDYSASYQVLGSFIPEFLVESYSASGTASYEVVEPSEEEHTATGSGDFSGSGVSSQHGAFSTRRSTRYTSFRKATAWDSDGNPTSFDQGERERRVISVTLADLKKTMTLAVEQRVDRVGVVEYSSFFNGKEFRLGETEEERAQFDALRKMFMDLEKPDVDPGVFQY